jgi:hypothetical protein
MKLMRPTKRKNMNAFKTLVCMAALASSAWVQAADVGVSVQVSQPGVYGRIDIGRFPQPQLVVAQPVVIVRPVQVVQAPPEPVYMWVPPGHRKHWRKHCGRYGACGVPVYFVQDRWYGEHVHPVYRERRDWRDNRDDRRQYRSEYRPEYRRDDRDGDGRGPGGRGHGKGHDKGRKHDD